MLTLLPAQRYIIMYLYLKHFRSMHVIFVTWWSVVITLMLQWHPLPAWRSKCVRQAQFLQFQHFVTGLGSFLLSQLHYLPISLNFATHMISVFLSIFNYLVNMKATVLWRAFIKTSVNLVHRQIFKKKFTSGFILFKQTSKPSSLQSE